MLQESTGVRKSGIQIPASTIYYLWDLNESRSRACFSRSSPGQHHYLAGCWADRAAEAPGTDRLQEEPANGSSDPALFSQVRVGSGGGKHPGDQRRPPCSLPPPGGSKPLGLVSSSQEGLTASSSQSCWEARVGPLHEGALRTHTARKSGGGPEMLHPCPSARKFPSFSASVTVWLFLHSGFL